MLSWARRCPRRWSAPGVILLLVVAVLLWPNRGRANAEWVAEGQVPWESASYVAVREAGDGQWQYVVNGEPQVFIGMGYNPIYRFLPDEQRAANYHRDFRILCEAGVNHITGWDFDAGVEQDKFDELTLDIAHKYGLGVIMPFYLPKENDYRDEAFTRGLLDDARQKIDRYKHHPALRIWGLGNEVLLAMPRSLQPSFARFYLRIADLFHRRDPNHPVMYREDEDHFLPAIAMALGSSRRERPWFLYGMNVYSPRLEFLLDDWPNHGLDRPLFITEFGAEPYWPGGRTIGYVNMWRTIRAHARHVPGGAPYVWTTEGPEEVDKKWGLMTGDSEPVDETFEQLAAEWRKEPGAVRNCSGE